MEIINKPVILKSNGEEEPLEINALYEFEIDNFEPQIGKLVSAEGATITFDCSSEYNSKVRSYALHRVHSMKKVKEVN